MADLWPEFVSPWQKLANSQVCGCAGLENSAFSPGTNKKMVDIKLFAFYAIATAALSSTAALAQKPPFEGPSLGYNLTVSSTSTEMMAGTARLSGLGWTTLGAGLQAAYGFPVGNTVVLSLGATYKLSDTSSGEFSAPGNSFGLKVKNSHFVYFEPGLKMTERVLAYGKIGYEGGRMRSESGGGCLDRNLDGIGYGLGLRVHLSNRIYLQSELKQTFYRSVSFPPHTKDVTASGTQGLMGVGYAF